MIAYGRSSTTITSRCSSTGITSDSSNGAPDRYSFKPRDAVAADRALEPDREIVALLEHRDVGDGLRRRDVGLIPGRERVAPDPEGVDAGLFATRGDERVAQLVGPSARDRRELGLERGFVDRRRVAARRLHHDVQPREHGVARRAR